MNDLKPITLSDYDSMAMFSRSFVQIFFNDFWIMSVFLSYKCSL